MKLRIIILIVFLMFSGRINGQDQSSDIRKLWYDCNLTETVPFGIFNSAILGLNHITGHVDKSIITIIDFSKPSSEKRFYVIDIKSRRLLYSCLVAHGKNSGENYAKSFSNSAGSLMSSLGFFLTAETYSGTHGYSLRVDGLEKGINDNARAREIVIHGADYVSDEYVKKYGRLGRSWGCPALPQDMFKAVIDKISGGTCLYIYGDDDNYNLNSVFLK